MKKDMEQEYILVLCSFPDKLQASQSARKCVEKRLAACAQVSTAPCESIYWWNDNLETAQEHQVWFKTKAETWEALRDEIQRLHPFEVPEILSIPVNDGLKSYLKWLSTEISK